jgi:cytochrome c55X
VAEPARVRLLSGATLACGYLAAAAAAAPGEARQAELLHRLRHDCGSCHGMTFKGGLGPALLPATLAGRAEEELARIVLDGIPRTPMPPWGVELSEAEALWLVRRLKEGLDATD